MSEPVYRPRRWWLAFLLNLIVPPTGYAYVGAWMAVAATVVGVLLGAVALNEWTLIRPPGIYAFGPEALLYLAVVFAVGLAAHAAWLAVKAPPRTGPSKAVLYVAPWFLLLLGNMVLRAYWPNPVYTVSSTAMAPTLQPGDIVMVDGARALCGHPGIKVGDVVLHKWQGSESLLRIVAGPGQTVAMPDRVLMIDGQPVQRRPLGSVAAVGGLERGGRLTEIEEVLPGGVRYRTQALGPDGAPDRVAPVTIPAGSWYLLGDNRDDAADSRRNGPAKGADICATAVSIVSAEDKRRVGQKP